MRLADAPWAALRTVIRHGARLMQRPARPFLPLDAGRLVDAARRQSGVPDVEVSSFLEGLHRLLHSLETEARLNLLGRVAVREDITRLLANRFRVERDRRLDAGIAAQEIRRPIFITGVPRSGSTLLQRLLAEDSANRVAQTWEMLDSSPPPDRATYDRDPRIRAAERELMWFQRLTPEFRAIHPVGARLPEECVIILAHSFVSSQFSSMYVVPSYDRWVDAQDARPAYQLHRRFLQHLQRRLRGERWVLKAPAHLPRLSALLSVYPDARIVMTHREPLEVLASEASLLVTLREMFSDAVDPLAVGREVTHVLAEHLRRGLRARDQGLASPDQFFDVDYRDLLAHPIAVVRRIYAHFEMPLSAMATDRMERFLGAATKDRYGVHAYTLAQFGFDPDEVRRRYRDYRDRFLRDGTDRT